MTATKVTVHGDERLAATMTAAAAKLGHMDAANRRVGMAIAQRARSAAPRRSGALARSTSGRPAQANGAEITATVVYAGVIHNGWPRHHIRANPYIRKTVEQYQAEWVDNYGTEVDKILNTIKGA